MGRLASQVGAGARRAAHGGRYAEGPWFDNNLAFLQLAGPSLRMWWVTGEVVDDHDRPRLAKVESYALDEDGNPPPRESFVSKASRRVRRRAKDDSVRER